MRTVDAILDELWACGASLDSASKIFSTLNQEEVREVELFVDGIAFSGRLLESGAPQSISRPEALFLAALARYHSDSVAGLPGNLRKRRMEILAKENGISISLIQEAIRLGPIGVERHLSASS